MSRESEYIHMLALASSTKWDELIPECLQLNGVLGTRELTEEQLEKFIKMKSGECPALLALSQHKI